MTEQFIPVARVMNSNNQATSLVVYDCESRLLTNISRYDARVEWLSPRVKETIDNLPISGTISKQIVVAAQDSYNYICYIDGKLYLYPLEDIQDMTENQGYKLNNAKIVSNPDGRVYIRHSRGAIFKYNTMTKVQKIENTAWVLQIKATAPFDTCNALYLFKTYERAFAKFNKLAENYQARVSELNWLVELDTTTYTAYLADDYENNHIQMTLRRQKFEDCD